MRGIFHYFQFHILNLTILTIFKFQVREGFPPLANIYAPSPCCTRMMICRKRRSYEISAVSAVALIYVVYKLISIVQDPSDFNKIIYPRRVLSGVEEAGQAHLPTIEQNYQKQVVDKRQESFIQRASSPYLTSNAVFWSYFPSWPEWCPHQIERIGGILWNWAWRGEGGKWICGLDLLSVVGANNPSPCIMYSYGIEDDTTFEEAFLSRTRSCTVHMFDPTVDSSASPVQSLLRKYPNRATFSKTGLSSIDSNDKSYRTLASEMKLNGHVFIDVLKVDIEGSEFGTMKNIIQDFMPESSPASFLPLGQLQIEIHLPNLHRKEDADLFVQFKNWYELLETAGLRPFHSEPNPISATRPTDHVKYYEYSFINVRAQHFILSNYTLPKLSIEPGKAFDWFSKGS